MSWNTQINWNGEWITISTGHKTRDDAEWATGKWKQANNCMGDPFRAVRDSVYRVGTLRKNDNGRWELVLSDRSDDAVGLSCGSVIEVKIGGQWIKTGIEHAKGDYYATTPGILLQLGLTARVK